LKAYRPTKILFLGETYRADAQTWIKGIEYVSGLKIDTLEVQPTQTRLGRFFMFLVFLFQIFRTNLTKSYDIVLAERSTSYGFFSIFVNAKKRVIAQQGITDIWPPRGWALRIKPYFQNKAYRNADLIHAWGEVMVPAMLEAKADPDRIMVLPKGIDLELYDFLDFDKKQRNLAVVTRSLTSVYNHSDILKALGLLKAQGMDVQVIIVGDGCLKPELEMMVRDLNLGEMVSFTGRIPNEQLPGLLQHASMYISVPETEGVSASLFEAMATGCFPIVTDLPGTRAFIRDGENGFLVPVNQPQAIAEAIVKYLRHAEKFQNALRSNRKYIEENADLTKNMQKIWEKYISLFATEELV